VAGSETTTAVRPDPKRSALMAVGSGERSYLIRGNLLESMPPEIAEDFHSGRPARVSEVLRLVAKQLLEGPGRKPSRSGSLARSRNPARTPHTHYAPRGLTRTLSSRQRVNADRRSASVKGVSPWKEACYALRDEVG